MVSVEHFIYSEPAVFRATCDFVRKFKTVKDPIMRFALSKPNVNAQIAWTILGSVLFQNIGYSEFACVMNKFSKEFANEKLWSLPVPTEKQINSCVKSALCKKSWSLSQYVSGIFWSVGLFVRRHTDLNNWVKSRTPQELWRDLGEIYFMGKASSRPKVCATIYRLLSNFPIGLGLKCKESNKWPQLPLNMGVRRFLSILGPANASYADMNNQEKLVMANDLYVAIARTFFSKGEFINVAEISKKSWIVAHGLQFFLEVSSDGFICKKVTKKCTTCPLRMYCNYAEKILF